MMAIDILVHRHFRNHDQITIYDYNEKINKVSSYGFNLVCPKLEITQMMRHNFNM